MNVDVPSFACWLRSEYLYNLESHHGETTPVVVFGLSSIAGRAVGFHVLTDTGAVIWRLPVSALVHRPDAPALPLHSLELWDCFSYDVHVHAFGYLREMRCRTILKDGQWYPAIYQFTIDWYGSSEAESPGDSGHKCGHVLKLDNGCYAIQPNNRIQWLDPAHVVRPFVDRPDYLTNQHVWKVENQPWRTEDAPVMFYETT